LATHFPFRLADLRGNLVAAAHWFEVALGIFRGCSNFRSILLHTRRWQCNRLDDVMNITPSQKQLDIIISTILMLILLLSFSFRASPISFINPGFPILRADDLSFSDKFFLDGRPKPKRITNLYDFNEVTYELVFHLQDTSQVFPDSDGEMRTTGFSIFQFVTRFSNLMEAEKALQQLHKEYIENEGDFPLLITDIPLARFSSMADKYLLWCEQYSHEFVFNAEEVQSCYYWAVYGRYLSRVRLSMWPIVGGGRRYSLELFNELITLAEGKMLSATKR
jgi:hypothetical protein